MDRVRSTFNNLINGKRYNRFTLQPEEEGGTHMEVKLSDDALDDTTEVSDQVGGSRSFRPPPRYQNRRTIFYVTLGTLLFFTIGYLIGYLSPHKPRQEVGEKPCPEVGEKSCSEVGEKPCPEVEETPVVAAEPSLYWNDITRLLREKITSQNFDSTLLEFNLRNRTAGSNEDMHLGNKIFSGFKNLEMKTWTDIHYVQLQKMDSKRPNTVTFGSSVFQPKGYLAYSANGLVQGKVVYGSYGRKEDLDVLQKKNIDLRGSVMLLRAGSISFAQQVANAAEKGAAAVLIYPDHQNYQANTELYGHVHLGSGDPYTPGFPSFNHTQFPPTQSSGLPTIPAQTITAQMATTILQNIGGPEVDPSSGFNGALSVPVYKLGGVENITVEVNNVLVNTEIHNVFGVIKGFVDPDRYVVLGAQRDAWGPGYARAAVGTTILMELAKAVHEMVENDGFRPKRSLVFASLSAGEYGNVGLTEWLEGYMSSLNRKAFTYISLDGVVMGRGSFVASASPLLQSLLERTMKTVMDPLDSKTMYDMVGKAWETKALRPMSMEDPAYPVLTLSGIPSVSFHFISPDVEAYPYYGTVLDNMDHLNAETNQHTSEMATVAAQFAGQMALRLVHDHVLSLDVNRYSSTITKSVVKINSRINQLSKSGQLDGVSAMWLNRARSSFSRAAASIRNAISNTDLTDKEACRILNDRLMTVEHTLLSPYVSPKETPFRHLLLGRGPHTLAAISEITDVKQLHTQLALATWTLQGCVDAMAENIWDIDNEI
ncbi:transferrin receptor 1b [Lampris incognitus]|uniref:transferrin receptor 1b n=1 Tax=Lampris incognitus TaxID=2546036 RepID=UPI0024B52EB7|nr:transferrin receptor 1b [Lampris incognitus]